MKFGTQVRAWLPVDPGRCGTGVPGSVGRTKGVTGTGVRVGGGAAGLCGLMLP